jgi:hypothetical protein
MHTPHTTHTQELLRLNVVKGASNLLRAANPIGHASVGLAEICTQPFKRHELELRRAFASVVCTCAACCVLCAVCCVLCAVCCVLRAAGCEHTCSQGSRDVLWW